MSSDEINIEKRIGEIVIDAIASHADIQHECVVPNLSLVDIESLDLQEVLMEIEEQCDRISPLDKRNLRLLLPDAKVQEARTVADLNTIVLSEIEALLRSESGDTKTR